MIVPLRRALAFSRLVSRSEYASCFDVELDTCDKRSEAEGLPSKPCCSQ